MSQNFMAIYEHSWLKYYLYSFLKRKNVLRTFVIFSYYYNTQLSGQNNSQIYFECYNQRKVIIKVASKFGWKKCLL